jgi:nucleoid DNA-binding protein
MAIILLIMKPVFALIYLNMARKIQGQEGVQIPTFGNWNNNTNQPNQAPNYQTQPQFGGYQEQ